jgi:hypothetical protein
VFTDTVVVDGNGAYKSASFTPKMAGTYRWVASYSGDSSNEPVSGSCGAADQSVVVSKLIPPPPCEKPARPRISNYLPPFRADGRYVLGVRARTTVPAGSSVAIKATLLFRHRGKLRTRVMGTRKLARAGTRRFRFVLPAGLRKRLPRRRVVRLRLDAVASADCGASSRTRITLKTRIVKVLAHR